MNPASAYTDIASTEFFRELAMENGITLRWATTLAQSSRAKFQMQAQTLQSDNLRRLPILAVGPDLSKRKSMPGWDRNNSLDLFPFQ